MKSFSRRTLMTNEQFSRAVHDYADTVYHVALNYLKNPHNAEDVTQEVFLRLYRAAKVPEGGEHTKSSWSLNCPCVVVAGWEISERLSPRFVSRV